MTPDERETIPGTWADLERRVAKLEGLTDRMTRVEGVIDAVRDNTSACLARLDKQDAERLARYEERERQRQEREQKEEDDRRAQRKFILTITASFAGVIIAAVAVINGIIGAGAHP